MLTHVESSELADLLHSSVDQFTNGGQFTNYTNALEATHNTLEALDENPALLMQSINDGGENYDQVATIAQNLLLLQSEFAKSTQE
jgi:hypothetical protein